jgi:peptidoglycan/LPS O-acetylase OafA/YrhL
VGVAAVKKLRSLEMLRAIAALLVVLFHVQGVFVARSGILPFGGLFGSGFRGVDLFFVLSGFIIAHVHARDIDRPSRLGNYLFSRAARIYPSVWIMTALAGTMYMVGFGGAEKIGKLTSWSVAASLLLLPQAGDALVNVTWTLKYELFFYLMFAVMIVSFRSGLALFVAWQFLVFLATVWLRPPDMGLAGFYLRSLCLDFSVGIICAWLVRRPRFVEAARTGFAQYALVAGGAAAFLGGMSVQSLTASAGIPCALGAGALIVGLTLLERAGRIVVPNFLVQLGDASYAIYLVHFSAITLLAVLVIRMRHVPLNDATFLAVASVSVGAGVAFNQLCDKPIQLLLRRKRGDWQILISRLADGLHGYSHYLEFWRPPEKIAVPINPAPKSGAV